RKNSAALLATCEAKASLSRDRLDKHLTCAVPPFEIALTMRTKTRARLLVVLFIAGSAALLLFAQLRGNVAPMRSVQDPYPVFADLAVDPDANIVAVADENKFSLRTYDRDLKTADVADPRTVLTGTKTGIDFVCGVAVDATHKQIYTANNDTAADVMVFNY